MKKRIKLTEKELAIGSWLYVKMRIKYDQSFITAIKYDYLNDHHMIGKWPSLCILCDKHKCDKREKGCLECPLDSCGRDHKTLWAIVTNMTFDKRSGTFESPFTLEERLDACDKIIEAIEKDIPDDYVSQHEEE